MTGNKRTRVRIVYLSNVMQLEAGLEKTTHAKEIRVEAAGDGISEASVE